MKNLLTDLPHEVQNKISGMYLANLIRCLKYKDKIYIIDFGDANLIEDKNESSSEISSETSSFISPFVNDFINGLNQWNPDFR